MKEIPHNVKALLKAHGVPAPEIELIHQQYNISFAENNEKKQQTKEAKKSERPSVRDMARESRIIK